MQNSDSEKTTSVEALKTAEQLINSIPANTDLVLLIEQLRLVCQELSLASDIEATLFVQTVIKARFRLNAPLINSLLRSIRELRKRNHLLASRVPKVKKNVETCGYFQDLIDVVDLDGRSAFLYKSPDGQLAIEEKIELDDRIIVPPPLERLPYPAPSAERVMVQFEQYNSGSVRELDERLYDDLLFYLEESADLPDPAYYHLLTAWVFHTYLMEYFYYSPILLFFGQPAIGKSRLGRALIHASFRGVQVESLSSAHLIRYAGDQHASVFFDIKNLGKKLSRENSLDLLLLRCERGAIAPRVTNAGKGAILDTRYYDLFGPTIVACNETFDDSAFESRTLFIRMQMSTRHFSHPVTADMVLPLRERLTAFRAWHFDEALPPFIRTQDGRMGDLTNPIYQVIEMIKPGARGAVDRTIEKLRGDTWVCRQETPEIRILTAVKNLAEHNRTTMLEVYEIWQHVNGVREGLPVISRERIGRFLTAAGFRRERGSTGRSAIVYSVSSLSALLSRYGMVFMPVVPMDLRTYPLDGDSSPGI